MTLRDRIYCGLALIALVIPGTYAAEAPDPGSDVPEVTVYKSPTCGCCEKWVEHLRSNGFSVQTRDTDQLAEIKQMHGITPSLASCHTAVIGPYVVEGHVPAEDIRRLLAERPPVLGITAPGMPMGSPGMEGGRVDAYDVLAFDDEGKVTVFSRH